MDITHSAYYLTDSSNNHLSAILQQFHDFYSLGFDIFFVQQLFCGEYLGSVRSDFLIFAFRGCQEGFWHRWGS